MSLHSFTHAIDVINYQLNEDRPLHVFVIETMKELHKRLNEYKKRYSVYSFDDITRETLRILNENDEICQYFKSCHSSHSFNFASVLS